MTEMYRVVDTVLVDQEAIYAPRQGNDRLLLGLKGSLNEYELEWCASTRPGISRFRVRYPTSGLPGFTRVRTP